MRVLIQRVRRARVLVEGEVTGEIGGSSEAESSQERGLLLLVGLGPADDASILEAMARKIVHLRIFADDTGKMNRSLIDVEGPVLAVPQFTLFADCRKGRRPSFTGAAPPELGARLFESFVEALRSIGVRVETGRFGAMMDVELLNDGPVTIWLDSETLF